MTRTVSVKLIADVANFTRNVGGTAVASVKTLSGELDRANKAGKLDHVTTGAMALGAGLVGVGGFVTKLAMDFDKQMSNVQAATHASTAEIGKLRQASLDAGKSTAFSATEAAQGVEELAKAGVSTSSILGGGLAGALDLAAAGQIDVAEAAETAASAMTQFNLDGSKVPHVADLLAAAAGKAQGSVHDMSAALNQSGLVASQMGLSIEDTTGTLASFASAGLLGSDAGTSFKTMLLMLQNPTTKSAGLMQDLGISAYDTAGNFVGITNLAGQLQSKLAGLSQEQRDATMAQIFGSDAIRAANVLYRQGATGIQTWIDKTNDSGYAAETAAAKTDNLAGDLERLKGSIETLAIESGSGSTSGLRTLTQGFDRLVGSVSAIPAPMQDAAVVMAGISGVTLLAGGAVGKMRAATSEMLGQLAETGPAGAKAAGGLGKVASFAGKAAIALAAVNTAAALMGESVNAQVPALANGLADFGKNGQVAGEAARILGANLGTLRDDMGALDSGFWADFGNGTAGFIEGMTGIGNVMDHSLTHARERITAVDGALSQLVQSGRSMEAAAAFDQLAKQAAKSGVSVDELRKGLPQYQAALSGAGAESITAAKSVTGVGSAAEQAEAKVEELSKAFDDLFDTQMSIDRAAIKVREGMQALTTELTTGSRTLALNTTEGRKNRGAVLDQIDAIGDMRKARIKHGMSLDEADRKYKRDVAGLRNSMIQAGFSKKAVDGLLGAYNKIPDKVKTQVSATGVAGVQTALTRLSTMQFALKKGVSFGTAAAQLGDSKAARDRNLFHAGGWTGPGATMDEAGVVHADEFVIKKTSRKKIEQKHPGLLGEMNATGQLPGYAGGGAVWPFPTTAAMTRIPTKAQVLAAVTPSFGNWPSSPGAQRGDSGVWRSIVAMIRATGPMSGSFGNGYRAGDPLWHGSGRAVDWMGFNQDRLAGFLAAKRPLELIHRTAQRDYAYTRGVNKGSFNNSLMQAHRNHIHIAMANGGVINEPVFGYGASGRSYSFGERGTPETVIPGVHTGGGGTTININVSPTPLASPRDIGREVVNAIQEYEQGSGKRWRS